ncbi:glycosyltransferase [Planctomycetota bacterium]
MVYLAWFLFGCTLLTAARAINGNRRIARLADVPWDSSTNDHEWPSVSVVVAARNEERDIEAALQSLLDLDYPNLELITVDDRSTDNTGAILDSISQQCPALRVIHVDELPDGWLGKNNALQLGANAATGEFLIFTDADVIFDPTTLRRAITYAVEKKLDHLTATPHTIMPTALLNSFATTFTICFLTYFPPWQVRNQNSRTAIGIGAFNLVRRESYRQIGGHESIRMRPDDDVKLGKILKQSGCRPDIVNGTTMIRVPWYHTVREAVVGLEKNTFSGVDYSIAMTITGATWLLLTSVWPFAALLVTSGMTWWIYAALCLLLIAFAAWATQVIGVPIQSCLFHPISVGLIVFIMWRTMILVFRNDGIYWRDTHYSLAELKANRV